MKSSSHTLQVGDYVRVTTVPDWLLRDLPPEDQQRLRGQQGRIVKVLKLLPHGYLWLAFTDGAEGFSLHPTDVQLV